MTDKNYGVESNINGPSGYFPPDKITEVINSRDYTFQKEIYGSWEKDHYNSQLEPA